MRKQLTKFDSMKLLPVDFESLETNYEDDGYQLIFRFANGYGASVIKREGSYGYEEDLWELAVVKFDGEEDYNVVCDTPITDDVLDGLDDDEVVKILIKISEL